MKKQGDMALSKELTKSLETDSKELIYELPHKEFESHLMKFNALQKNIER